MDIRINGTATGTALAGRNVGQILAELDENAEKAGTIITGIRYNGRNLDADSIAEITGDPADIQGSLELSAEPVTEMKARAIDTLLQLVEAAATAGDTATLDAASSAWESYRSAFDGLYSAEECSFLDAFGMELAGNTAGNIEAGRHNFTGIEETAARLSSFFGERRAELQDPATAMLAAAQLFDSIRLDLSEVAVRLQTGKEAEGMHTMVIVVELINKTVRILPDFMRTVPGAAGLAIDGKNIGDFYDDFNVVFRELVGAFENKDSVLIGDLAEYEILPRLSAFFQAATAAMGQA